MAEYYPPLGFHFKVEFSDFPGEYQFQSVSGLNVNVDTEDIAEGGENRVGIRRTERSALPDRRDADPGEFGQP